MTGVAALLSVADKTGLSDLAQALVARGYTLLASGGTAKFLSQNNLPVTEVAQYTGSPEILGGRVKTLHPKIHGGILARRELVEDQRDLQAAGIMPIAVVVVNLYPFEQTIAQPEISEAEAIEQIDIGGVALLRAAAKNFQAVSVLSDPAQYPQFIQALQADGVDLHMRRGLAGAAFRYTSRYDQAIARWFGPPLPTVLDLHLEEHLPLRYGENPHQQASWYTVGNTGFTTARILQGKPLSFNNLMDLEAARRTIAPFLPAAAAVIIKHANPCGVALGQSLHEAYARAYSADSTSAFGGIVGLTQTVDEATAQQLAQTFLECILAPGFSPEALEVLTRKSQLRLLELPDLSTAPRLDLKAVSGGFLVQQSDTVADSADLWQVVTELKPTPQELQELLFAWRVVKQVKSNAIVLTKDLQTIGIGAGQMNRVGAAQLAFEQAGVKAQGAALASDGFFPFEDTVRLAYERGIRAVVQPGGSKRDINSIAACNELGMVMVFTGVRHFLH
ncbi:bifunctional phosphoribosylaminoimidazolecarboxamide formyltransferase/IMP cyclohydrolase [Anthocerotibacter panamensis]|uniref:bifunctional phosphoribosylaminoimidazolecarboxamide formyltransferase/IMP cyclohydrolase n=1 Tax=Anthocerotibacter panamensis TaxID=2857077 RepID=UPI001C4069F0